MEQDKVTSEVATTPKNTLGAATTPPAGAWGTEGTSQKDLRIPRLQLCQQISQSVKDEHAKAGDIITDTNEMIAPRGKELVFVPIMTYREWVVYKVDPTNPKKQDFFSRFPVTPDNEGLPQKDVDTIAGPIQRTMQMHFFGLLRGHANDLPFVLTFQKTSMKAGRILSTAIQTAGFKGKPAASQAFKIGVKKEVKDNNDYYVYTVDPAGDSTGDELAKAWEWWQKLSAQQKQVAQLARTGGAANPALSAGVSAIIDSGEEVPF